MEIMQTNEMMNLIDTIEIDSISGSLMKINKIQGVIQNTLKSGHDYDTIPGTQKPTLLKPGAEKILMLFGLTSEYDVIESVEDWKNGVFAYTVKCTLLHQGRKVTEGLGSCNSKEDKYRYRWVSESDVPAGMDLETLKKNNYGKYRVENDEIYSQVNTILKMAKKRAQVDATLTTASLSELFTQDMEDMRQFAAAEAAETMTAKDAEKIKLTFGKHKGKFLGEIMMEDESYIKWLADNARDNLMKQAAQMLMQGSKEAVNNIPKPKAETSNKTNVQNNAIPDNEEYDQEMLDYIDSQPVDYLG